MVNSRQPQSQDQFQPRSQHQPPTPNVPPFLRQQSGPYPPQPMPTPSPMQARSPSPSQSQPHPHSHPHPQQPPARYVHPAAPGHLPPFGPIRPGQSLAGQYHAAQGIPPTPRAQSPQRLGNSLGFQVQPRRLLWLGGGLLALGLFLSNGLGRWGNGLIAKSFKADLCLEVLNPAAALSRAQLTALIAVPERSPKATIREQAPEPYCLLSEIEVRAGVPAQREAYPLAFDPDTWLVMLYEGEEYAGYALQFQ